MNYSDATTSGSFENPFLTQGAEQSLASASAFALAESLPFGSEERAVQIGRGWRLLKQAKISSRLAVAYAFDPTTQAARRATLTVTVPPTANPAETARGIQCVRDALRRAES